MIIAVTEKEFKALIAETVKKVIGERLNENEGDAMRKARKYIKDLMPNVDPWGIINQIRNMVPNVRIYNSKFLPGITMLLTDKYTNSVSTMGWDGCDVLNDFLLLLSKNPDVANKTDGLLSGWDWKKILEYTEKQVDDEKPSIGIQQRKYNIIPIFKWEDNTYDMTGAEAFAKYFDNAESKYGFSAIWCICSDDQNYFITSYNGGKNTIYFCIGENAENIPAIRGDNFPLDDYGLSMLCVILYPNGKIHSITTRWNHLGRLMNKSELSLILGSQIKKIQPKPITIETMLGDFNEYNRNPSDFFPGSVDYDSDGFEIVMDGYRNVLVYDDDNCEYFLDDEWKKV